MTPAASAWWLFVGRFESSRHVVICNTRSSPVHTHQNNSDYRALSSLSIVSALSSLRILSSLLLGLSPKSNLTLFSLLCALEGVNRKLSSVGVGGGASGFDSVPCMRNSGRLRLGDGCALMDALTSAVRSIGGSAM